MMNQLAFDYSLYNGTPPHVAGDTSRAAAQLIKPNVNDLQRRIENCIGAVGDATCDEIEWRLDLAHQTASARIRELVQLGLIHDTGRRRPTRSGRQARVYARS